MWLAHPHHSWMRTSRSYKGIIALETHSLWLSTTQQLLRYAAPNGIGARRAQYTLKERATGCRVRLRVIHRKEVRDAGKCNQKFFLHEDLVVPQ